MSESSANSSTRTTPRLAKRWFLRHQRLVAGGLGLLAVVALGVLASDVVAIGPVQRGMAAALATLVVVAAIERSDGTLRRSLRANPLPYLGRLAHGTYVWHWPVFVVIGALAPDAQPYQLAILTLLLGLALAALTHELVERPIQSQERFGLARGKKVGYLAASVIFGVGMVALFSARTGQLWAALLAVC